MFTRIGIPASTCIYNLCVGSRAVVLHSGGIDSTTALFWARKRFDEIIALNIIYGQKHSVEALVSKRLCSRFGIERVEVDLSSMKFLFSTSSLVSGSNESVNTVSTGAPPTYVPLRNTLFGIVAGVICESRGVDNIVFGIHASDSDYPDTRPEWASSLEAVLNTGSKFSFEKKRIVVHTPFVSFTKREIVELADQLGVPFELTWSCYFPKTIGNIVKPCSECLSCNLRRRAFEEAKVKDPLTQIEL